MYSLVVAGPLIYRTALLEQLRTSRGDIRISAQSNHVSDAPALIAAAMPDAALVISILGEDDAVREVKRIRRVDVQARLVWWALNSRVDTIAAALAEYEVQVVSWEANADDLVAAIGAPPLPGKLSATRPRLTAQEHLILQLAADGLSNRAIAFRLGVAENTVKNHFRHIGAKFNTSSRAQAVWQAVQWGYLTPLVARA